jgi:hypothetical protein
MGKGTRFYIVEGGYKPILRTVTYISDKVFEWNYGWAFRNQLHPNPNLKSKVKYMLKP